MMQTKFVIMADSYEESRFLLYRQLVIGEISLMLKHPIVYEVSSLEDIRIGLIISVIEYFTFSPFMVG